MEELRELRVRTIEGRSLAVRVSPDDTVQNLKMHLEEQRLTWTSDSNSSFNFNLYHKGRKVDGLTQLSSISLLDNDFLVLVPLARKKKSKRSKLSSQGSADPKKHDTLFGHPIDKDQAASTAERKDIAGAENTERRDGVIDSTEAVWNACVADLAAAQAEASKDGEGVKSGSRDFESSAQTSVQDSSARDDAQPHRPEPDNHGYSGLLFEQLRSQSREGSLGAPRAEGDNRPGRLLGLPPILERLNSVFISLNALCGFLQKQHMQATWKTVRQALQQLCCPEGEEVTKQDIHLLAALCPRLIVLSNMTTDGEDSSFYIDLFDPSTDRKLTQLDNGNATVATNIEQIGPADSLPSSGGKRVSDKVIKNAIGRREKAFQKALMKLVEYLKKIGKAVNEFNNLTFLEVTTAVDAIAKEEVRDLNQKAELPKPPRGHQKVPRCTSVASLGALDMIDHLKEGLGSLGQIVHCEKIKQREASYGELRRSLTSYASAALRGMGIRRLYTHQAQAINAAMAGQSVVVATSTASGKSLCYNTPVLDEMAQNQESCALYLFPTKALAQDQLRALQAMTKNIETEIKMGVYDGDTPEDTRLRLRDTARLIITNPDMLHVSIMPSHRQFTRVLSNLRYVVVDEAHAYRGVFGCHTALIMRRLRRLCQYCFDARCGEISVLTSRNISYPFEVKFDSNIAGSLQSFVSRKQDAIQSANLVLSKELSFYCKEDDFKQPREWNLSSLKFRTQIDVRPPKWKGIALDLVRCVETRLTLCAVYGTEPTFIVCSATIANPAGHAQELLGLRNIEVVQNDGSPSGEKSFLFWNPPQQTFTKTNNKRRNKADTGPVSGAIFKRTSPIVEMSMVFAEMVQHNLRCIAFCKSRKLTELVYNYTREILKEAAPELVDAIRAYRGGYTPAERRTIESDLFAGKLRGVAATNALELGVDVGSLDATLHLGFPGTVASLWQQSGRAGRREKPSLSVYIAFGGPLDQHFMKAPGRLFSSPIENAQVDARNQQVLEQHLACAAVEYPLHGEHDDAYFGSGLQTAIRALQKQGRLARHPTNCPKDETWNFIGQEKFPSREVSIRAIDTERYKIIDIATNEVIEEVEESKAFFQIYEGAVYMNQGKTYLVKALDLMTKVALCQHCDLKYYTKTRDYTDVHVTGSEVAYPRNLPEGKYQSTTAMANACKVTTRFFGFRRIWRGSDRAFDTVELFLPDVSFDSQAVFIRVPSQIRANLAEKELSLRAGLHAANHVLVNVMPLYIMCNPSDLGTECANPQDTRYFPERLLVYDRHPGGIGIAAQARPMFTELLQAAAEVLLACECTSDDGCPCCVQTLDCSEYNAVLDKQAAKLIIQGVIQSEDVYRESRKQTPQPAHGFLSQPLV